MRTLIIALLLLPSTIFAQDIIGIWTGTLATSQKKLPYEIAIMEDSGRIIGYSYIRFVVDSNEIIAVKKLEISEGDGKIITEDKDLIFDTYKEESPKKIKQIDEFTFKSQGSEMSLTGSFTVKRALNLKPITGAIQLRKNNDPDSSKLYAKLLELNLANSLTFKQQKRLEEKVDLAITEEPRPDTTSQAIQQPKIVPAVKPEVIPPVEKKDTIAIAIVQPKEEPIAAPSVAIEKPKPLIPKPIDTIAKPAIKEEVKDVAIQKPAPVVQKPVTVTPKPVDTVAKPITKEVAVTKPVINKPQPAVVKPQPPPVAVQKPTPVAVQKPVAAAPKPVVQPKPQPVAVKAPPVVAPVAVVRPPAPRPRPLPVFVPTGSAKDIANRTIENIQTLHFDSDSVTITLYDNGYVDGDTVSILLNGSVIMGKQGLSTNPITKTIYTTDVGDSMQIVMYAENLGSLPPNTGVLILQDGKKRYEVRFSGDLKKNAAITLMRRKPGEE